MTDETPPFAEIGQRLFWLRSHLGFPTQMAFAQHLGWPPNGYSTFEKGTIRPSFRFLQLLDSRTGCDWKWILEGDARNMPMRLQGALSPPAEEKAKRGRPSKKAG